MKAFRSSYFAAGILPFCLMGITACGKPIQRSIPPAIGSLYADRGTIDAFNQACVTPNPTPAAPNPQAWWAAIDPQTRGTKVAVGYEYWSNTNPTCATTRQDNYRGVATYDLASLTALSTSATPIQSLITGAKLQLIVGGGMPAPVAIGTCLPNFGGVEAIEQLRPGYTVLTGLTTVPVAPPIVGVPQFPAGANRVSLVGVAVPGSSGRVTTSVGGGGQTVVVIDVKDLLIAALTRGDATFGIMLDGTTETLLQSTADPQVDCRTLVKVGSLDVEHL